MFDKILHLTTEPWIAFCRKFFVVKINLQKEKFLVKSFLNPA